MRLFRFGSSALLAFTLALSAQGVPQPAAKDNLDTVLAAWEKSMTDLKNFTAIVDRESLDKALQTKDASKGYAMFMKAGQPKDGSRAKLVLMNLKTKVEEKYICSGVFLYEYAVAQKVIRVHKMPQGGKQGQQESFLSFLFGMSAKQAKDRYQMDFVGQDKFYNYIRVRPKLPQDKNDFNEARLSLLRSNNLPAQIWYHQPNGKEIKWDFTEIRLDLPNMAATYFQPEQPKGWRMEWAQPAAPVAKGQPKK